MSFTMFAKHKRTPAELATKLSNALEHLSNGGGAEKDQESCAKYLGEMRGIMYGDGESVPDPALQTALVTEVHRSGLIGQLIPMLPQLYFETRKDAGATFNGLLRHPVNVGNGDQLLIVDYLSQNTSHLITILTGSECEEGATNNAAALTYGTMLREVVRYEPLCRHCLFSPEFLKLFDYQLLPTFEIASDAAASFREILSRHKQLVAEYLEQNFEPFFAAYNNMLEKGNYVTRRQNLKLLSELLLDRANMGSMLKYIGSVENLCLMMNLLRDEARSIQFEAFHVFKVFVANPNKPPPVLSILMKNREKMIGYLSNFQNDREDEQFIEEKAMLTRLLENMVPDVADQPPADQPAAAEAQ